MQRTNNGLLSPLEQGVLTWLAPRQPIWLSPDTLTTIGMFGALLTCIGYILAARRHEWLLLVNLGLLINWYGDSLDGRVARARGIERPGFGFFLDQSVDVLAQFLFAIGLSFSGLIQIEIVALGLAAYFMMTIHGLLYALVTNTFALATAGFGLTEARAAFFMVNLLFLASPPAATSWSLYGFNYANLLGIFWLAFHVILFFFCTWVALRRLRKTPL